MPSGPELCPKCKGFHYRNSPCIVRVAKSTAARKDVRQRKLPQPRLAAEVDSAPTALHYGIAGTQALPVDTNTKRPVGRPKTITDMKAYKAKWARDYRARQALSSQPQKGE